MLRKLKAMFAKAAPANKPDPIAAMTTIAVERNARASRNAQEALEDMLKMSDTMRHLAGKMK